MLSACELPCRIVYVSSSPVVVGNATANHCARGTFVIVQDSKDTLCILLPPLTSPSLEIVRRRVGERVVVVLPRKTVATMCPWIATNVVVNLHATEGVTEATVTSSLFRSTGPVAAAASSIDENGQRESGHDTDGLVMYCAPQGPYPAPAEVQAQHRLPLDRALAQSGNIIATYAVIVQPVGIVAWPANLLRAFPTSVLFLAVVHDQHVMIHVSDATLGRQALELVGRPVCIEGLRLTLLEPQGFDSVMFSHFFTVRSDQGGAIWPLEAPTSFHRYEASVDNGRIAYWRGLRPHQLTADAALDWSFPASAQEVRPRVVTNTHPNAQPSLPRCLFDLPEFWLCLAGAYKVKSAQGSAFVTADGASSTRGGNLMQYCTQEPSSTSSLPMSQRLPSEQGTYLAELLLRHARSGCVLVVSVWFSVAHIDVDAFVGREVRFTNLISSSFMGSTFPQYMAVRYGNIPMAGGAFRSASVTSTTTVSFADQQEPQMLSSVDFAGPAAAAPMPAAVNEGAPVEADE